MNIPKLLENVKKIANDSETNVNPEYWKRKYIDLVESLSNIQIYILYEVWEYSTEDMGVFPSEEACKKFLKNMYKDKRLIPSVTFTLFFEHNNTHKDYPFYEAIPMKLSDIFKD